MSTATALDRFGLRYAAGARAVVGILMAVAAPFAAPPAGILVCALVAVALAAWSVAIWVFRDRTWVWVADTVVMCALCLAQPLLVDPELLVGQFGWVSPVASLFVVALQWHTSPLPGAVAALLVSGAFVIGAAASPQITTEQALLVGGLWTLVEAALSRLLWRLLRRAGQHADAQRERRFAAEREAALARARRAEQRAHWATVHDTAASTLLMVGLGGVRGNEPWLPGQLDRDVAALRGIAVAAAGLQETVRRAVAAAHIPVDLHGEADRPLPGPAAGALGGALAESLENVFRHAGTGRAEVRLDVDDVRVRIRVRDCGRGFDPGAVPAGRHGLTRSVRDRMAQAGGRAVVESAPGRGTEVRLEWPR